MDGCGMCVAIDVVAGRCVFMGVGGKQFRHGRTVSPIDRWLACLTGTLVQLPEIALGSQKALACNPQRFYSTVFRVKFGTSHYSP